ncbi:uncharacterized protein LOC132196575 isoform X2 [Neocloeon triangulifer]|nr:uncharacterized protein LOC132196575 isoform X2 [Neocloeon triangulifer]XP_059475314.1 uncharacterized protein LOC132196575 isoform X2 [Neocloeon triangulifer]XP_059475315.1 uncharacterized protein LOC132196575 isoform X2 [Neocloeon triangulifer]XP_059475316.1 uncharacterized protein LOC132196575 isoform X2 [Neocloeon triangulifer]
MDSQNDTSSLASSTNRLLQQEGFKLEIAGKIEEMTMTLLNTLDRECQQKLVFHETMLDELEAKTNQIMIHVCKQQKGKLAGFLNQLKAQLEDMNEDMKAFEQQQSQFEDLVKGCNFLSHSAIPLSETVPELKKAIKTAHEELKAVEDPLACQVSQVLHEMQEEVDTKIAETNAANIRLLVLSI